jgi:hypothetical protein
MATIDERLQALAESMELLKLDQHETQLALQKLTAQTDRFVQFAQLVLSNHENRMRRLEGQTNG